jgi:hypothetical protein
VDKRQTVENPRARASRAVQRGLWLIARLLLGPFRPASSPG